MSAVQSRRPIQTPLGVVEGRDAVVLEAMHFDIDGNTLFLEGSINGSLASDPPGKQSGHSPRQNYHFFLRFFGVLAYQMIELDSACHLAEQADGVDDDSVGSSFDEILHSQWVARLGGKVTRQHKHYSLSTYDDVFEVVCEEYRLSVFQKVDGPESS